MEMADFKSGDFASQETQPFDSPPASPSGNDMNHWVGDKLGFMQDTVPFDDDARVEDEIRTQVMDFECEIQGFAFCGETQAMHLGCETHEVSLAGETQLLETSDCLDTQLLDHFDDEVAADSDDDVADFFNDNGEIFDGDSPRKGGNWLSGEENTQHGNERNRSMDVSDALLNEKRSSGKVAKFTSVRTAAFRASGLAARGATPKLPNSDSRSILTNSHSSDQGAADNTSLENSVGEEVDQLCVPSISGEKTNELRAGNKTARKLFADDSVAEIKEGFNYLAADCDDELAGLSYVDSQEPGEASQASALNFVEKLINDSCLDFEVEVDHGKRTDEKSKSVSIVKGPQELAKKVCCRSGAVGNNVFEWDDNREDEGGGAILCRRKEEFFGGVSHSRGSSTMPREPKGKLIRGSDSGLVTAADKRPALSDSILLRRTMTKIGRKVRATEKENKKDLVNELDKVSKDKNSKTREMNEVVDLGPDTQMAAEAIDALRLGDGSKLDVDTNSLVEKQMSSGVETGFSSGRVVTRQSKRRLSVHAIEGDMELPKAITKKARSVPAKTCGKNMEGCLKGGQLDKSDKLVGSSTDKRRGELSNEPCASKLSYPSSRGGAADVSSYPSRRRSVRNSRHQFNESGRNLNSTFDTPVKSQMPLKNVSPICMGDEYLRRSCKSPSKSTSLREIRSLTSPLPEPIIEPKSTRTRRDLCSIRVLFSQHLDEDVTKHQKKILARFGISEASSIMGATHFIADKFVRTRNMLEAIASGKPVVTTQWLESIEQVNIYIDEDAYILRDSKKEKEFGFSMPVSLLRARQHPLLQGIRVFVTPNTKPGKATIASLVKAVHGQAVERLGRSALKDDKVPDNLLVLSCEEDYNICLPFLERGAEIYSSELLLNGIVTQKLEFERYRLFADHVKRTRSTIWLRNDKGEFQPCHR